MSRFVRWSRRLAPLLALLALTSCSGRPSDTGSTVTGDGTSCYLFDVGSTCRLSLAPADLQEFYFFAPGTGQGLVDIGLTGSTTYATWVLRNPDDSYSTCDDFTRGIDQSCRFVINGGAGYLLSVIEREGRAGTTNLTVSWLQDLGSQTHPVPVSVDSLMKASVGGGGSSYFRFQAATSAIHMIAVTGLASQLSWRLYGDEAFTQLLATCDSADVLDDLACPIFVAAGSTSYLKVTDRSGAAQAFQLSIGSGSMQEGTPESPTSISVGAPPRTSSVDVFGHSYYTLTPDLSGLHTFQLDDHTVDVAGIRYAFPSDYAWSLYDDAALTHLVAECRDYRSMWLREHCAVSLTAGTPYYLRVDERAGLPNRLFDLTVVHRATGGGSSEGTIGAPRPIDFTSGWGQVAAYGSSYYAFRTGSVASSYRVMAASQVDDLFFAGSNLTWTLCDDPSFSSEVLSCGRATGIVVQSCLTPALAADTTYYLRVDERDGVPQHFGLFVTGGFAPLTLSSPQAPVTVPVGGDALHVVQDNTLSTGWYALVTGPAGTYRISANLATGDVFGLTAWRLYDDPAYSRQVARCFMTGYVRTEGATCTVSLQGATQYYLKVEAVGAQSGGPSSAILADNDLALKVEPVVR